MNRICSTKKKNGRKTEENKWYFCITYFLKCLPRKMEPIMLTPFSFFFLSFHFVLVYTILY